MSEDKNSDNYANDTIPPTGEKQFSTPQLVAIIKEQEIQLDAKKKEITEMNELYTVFKEESEELEKVLQQQIDLFEEDMKNQKQKHTLIEKSYVEQIQKQKNLHSLEQQEKTSQINKMTQIIEELKQKLNEAGIAYENSELQQDQQKQLQTEKRSEEVSEANVKRLLQELKLKDLQIEDLSLNMASIKLTLDHQKQIFEEFSEKMESQQKLYEDAMEEINQENQKEIEKLNKVILKKDMQIDKYELLLKNLKNQPKIDDESEKDVEMLRQLVVVQGKKLKQLAKDFVEYKEGAEKLLQAEKLSKDEEIDRLKEKIQKQTEQ